MDYYNLVDEQLSRIVKSLEFSWQRGPTVSYQRVKWHPSCEFVYMDVPLP